MNISTSIEACREFLTVDMHSDIIVDVMFRRLRGENSVILDLHLPKIKKGCVNVLVTPIVWDEPAFNCYSIECLVRNIAYLESEIVESRGEIRIATSHSEVIEGVGRGETVLILGTEGGKVLGYDVEYLTVLYKLGVRVLGLTWNLQNQISGGIGEPRDYGLSEFGVRVVEKANRLGVLVDVSHISNKGFWDVVETSKDPIIASHSNSKTVCSHRRNLTDEQVRAIAEKGGVIGVNFYPEFVSEKERTSIDDVLKHVNYLVDLVGVDHVGLGPDFIDYMSEYIMDVLRRSTRNLYSMRGLKYPEGLEDTSKIPNLTRKLLEHGYSKNDVKKILGENFLRVFKRVVG